MSSIHDSEGRESPVEGQHDDPVFAKAGDSDRWLDREILTGRSEEIAGLKNCRRPRVGVFRWCKRLVVGGVLFLLIVIGALVAAVWFSRTWLRVEGEKFLMSELSRQRIHLAYETAQYQFTRGLVLGNVTLYETEKREKKLITCSELGFSFDAVGMIQHGMREGFTTSFTTRDATVVCFENGTEIATLTGLRTEIVGRPNDVLIDQFRGRIGDLDFELEGKILATREQRRKKKEREHQADLDGKPKVKKIADFAFFHALLPWLEVKSREEGVRPEIRANFIVDHAAEAPVTVTGRFIGRNFNWKKVPLDSASVEFSFAEGDERLVLPAFNLVYDGGLITGAAVWNSGTNVANVERFQSAANIVNLLRDINPKIAPFAATLQQDEPPLLSATGQLRIKDFWNSDLNIHYRHQDGITLLLSNGPLKIEGINGQFHVANGGFQTDSLLATILGGSFEFGGSALIKADTPRYEGRMNVRGLPLQSIVNHFGGKQELPGILSGHFEGSGGVAMADLNGQGSMRIDAAKLYKVPVIGPVQNLMGSVVPIFGDAEKRSELTASFTVTNGLLESRDLVILADGTRVEVNGNLSLSNWQTQFEARGNLVGALGLVTGLVSKAMVVEGSGRADDLQLKMKSVPAEFASETVKGVFGVAKGGVGVVSNTVGAGLEGAQSAAGVVTEGVKAMGGGLEDGARMVGEGAKKLGEGLLKIIPGTHRDNQGTNGKSASPQPPVQAPQPSE
ncbi:MAG: hypothetical protein KDL87_09245, partial [Verrucomicrobiae bacterium]|nr:hypothetical protein [Verrucomicrobiae bacterium]